MSQLFSAQDNMHSCRLEQAKQIQTLRVYLYLPLWPFRPLMPFQHSCRLAQAKQIQTHRAAHPNFSGEVVRCGASQKKPLRDSTHSTALSGLIFWDVPQIAAYREKLISCQKGLDLFYRKRRGLRIVLKRTASDLLLLGWDKDMPLITRN